MRLIDIAKAVAPNATCKIIGIRPGEKLHEQMISAEDSRICYEYDDYYKIFPQIDLHRAASSTTLETADGPMRQGKRVPAGFCYSSDTNNQWMTAEDLRAWVDQEYPSESEDSPLVIRDISLGSRV
jgi:FlaA1/EpsC-like NDP-sugar epimerase